MKPPDFPERVREVLGLLCGKRPPLEMVQAWFDKTKDDERLQTWVVNQVALPRWAMGISTIDAAALMAGTPREDGKEWR